MSTAFQLHQIVAVDPATGTPVEAAALSIFLDNGSGGKGSLAGSVFGVNGSSISQPIASGADGIIRFRLPAGVYFLELEFGPNIITRPGFMSGNASRRDTGTGANDLPLPANIAAALLGRAPTGSDDRLFFAFNSSAAYVLRSLFDVTPPTDRTAARVLAVNGAGTGLEWVTLPSSSLPALTGNAGRVLQVNGTEDGTAWVPPPELVFPTFAGQEGKVLRVNGAENGVEWTTANPLYSINVTTSAGNRTITAGDHNTIIEASQSGSINYVLALNSVEAVPTGTLLTIIKVGTGDVSISAATGVTLNGVDARSVVLPDQWDAITLYKRSTNGWVISGKFEVP